MIRRALETLGAGCVVYVMVVACGSEAGQKSSHSAGGSAGVAIGGGGLSGNGGAGGVPVDASEDAFDAIADVLTDPVPDATANESGSRLKARRWIATDGAKQFLGWRDTQLNVDCSFNTAEDGSTRCLPSGSLGSSYYLDAACTVRVVLGITTCGGAQPSFASEWSLTTCAQGYVVYELGAPTPVSSIYSKSSSGTCTAQTLGADYVALAVGNKRPPTDFVEATVQID